MAIIALISPAGPRWGNVAEWGGRYVGPNQIAWTPGVIKGEVKETVLLIREMEYNFATLVDDEESDFSGFLSMASIADSEVRVNNIIIGKIDKGTGRFRYHNNDLKFGSKVQVRIIFIWGITTASSSGTAGGSFITPGGGPTLGPAASGGTTPALTPGTGGGTPIVPPPPPPPAAPAAPAAPVVAQPGGAGTPVTVDVVAGADVLYYQFQWADAAGNTTFGPVIPVATPAPMLRLNVPAELPLGTYGFIATAYNAAGNTASAATNFVVA